MQWRRALAEHIRSCMGLYVFVLFLFLCGVMAGGFMRAYVNEAQADDMLSSINGALSSMDSVDTGSALWQAIHTQLPGMLLIAVMGLALIGIPVILAVVVMRGFFFGFCCSFLLGAFGWQGFLMILVALVPPLALWLPSLLGLSVFCIRSDIAFYKQRRALHNQEVRKKLLQPYSARCVVFGLVTLCSCFMEAFLTPVLLEWIITI